MSSLIQTELVATCNSLGSLDGETYYKEPECLESIKDLIRFLKRDDNSHEIRRLLGEINVLQTDLIHILKASTSKEDNELFSILIRLLVNLTMPTLVVFENTVPDEKMSRKYYLEIIGYLQEYKKAFCDEVIWMVLSDKLGNLLKLDWEHRQEDDKLLLEWILILIRNILHIPANPSEEMRTDDDASIHDRALWAFHKSGLEDLLLFIANSDDYHEFCLHTLEIVTLLLREQNPQQLASAGANRSQSEKQRDEQDLIEIRQREIARKQAVVKKYQGTRHTRFGGTFCVKDVKSISERELIVHRAIQDITALNFDRNKNRRKTPKNQRPTEELECTRRSTLSIRLFLKDFCVEFLNNAYNSIMYIVKDQLARQRTQDHDETYYLWAIRFFMEFNRLYEFQVELVSETMSVTAFHYIQTQLENYQEMMISEKSDKKKIALWAKRMHLALKAYQELIMTLTAMDNSTVEKIRDGAKVIKTNLFYTLEYRELPYILLHHFDKRKMSKAYLKDLVEMNHVFLRLLEKHCKHCAHLYVEKTKQAKRSKTKKKSKASNAPKGPPSEESLHEIWGIMQPKISSAMQGQLELPGDIIPFDAASDTPIDDQKDVAMRRIQGYLRTAKPLEALALFRAAREVWPEGDNFGTPEIAPEDELLALQEVLFANLPEGPIIVENANKDSVTEEGKDEDLEPEELQSEDEEEAQAKAASSRAEKEFDFRAFVARFATAKVINAYALLLHQYESNSTFTNHCLIKMFHRFAWDCKMPAIIFQASIFRDFQKILADPKLPTSSSLKEIVKFIKFILQKFFEVAKDNNKVFIELLFWKGSKDAFAIEEGYSSYKNKDKNGTQQGWTENQEADLLSLYEEFKNKNEPGKDVVDLLVEEFSDDNRTRKQIIRQLKRQGVALNLKTLRKSGGGGENKRFDDKIPREFTEEEITDLRDLFERFKDADDTVARILDNLTIKRPKKRVVQKLLDLGIVSDKKELRKKSKRRSKKSNDDVRSHQSSNSDSHNTSSSRSGSSKNPRAKTTVTARKKRTINSFDSSSDSSSSSEDEYEHEQTNANLLEILKSTVEMEDLRGPISWVKDDLKDIGDDREAEVDGEAAPLVPILVENHEALSNPHFVNLLKSLGLKPPDNEQEIYWRYPVSLTSRQCHEKAKLLDDALQGKLQTPPDQGADDDDNDADVPTSRISKTQSSFENESSEDNDTLVGSATSSAVAAEIPDNDNTEMSSSRTKQKKPKKIIQSDSEDDVPISRISKKRPLQNEISNDNDALPINATPSAVTVEIPDNGNQKSPSSRTRKPKRKKIIIQSDSEDDVPPGEELFLNLTSTQNSAKLSENLVDKSVEYGGEIFENVEPEENIGNGNKRKASALVNDESVDLETDVDSVRTKKNKRMHVIESDSE